MDTAGEIALFILGIVLLVSFAVCILATCCGCDTNWQEKQKRAEDVAYLGQDDRWYPGVRGAHKQDPYGWWQWLRGKTSVTTVAGDLHWMDAHHVIEIDYFFRPKSLYHLFPQKRKPSDIEDGTAPVFGNYMRAYTPVWSFVINNMIIAIATGVGFEVRVAHDISSTVGFFIIFGITLATGVLVMLFFFYFFGFGEAMLAPKRPKVMSNMLVHKLFHGKVELHPCEAMIMNETNWVYGPRLKFNYMSKIYLEKPKPPPTLQRVRFRPRRQ